MRTGLYFNKFSRAFVFDAKKIIIIAILARLIFASFYDIFVTVADRDFLLPDGKFYSISGWYLALLMSGYDRDYMPVDAVPAGKRSWVLFHDCVMREHKWGMDKLPSLDRETTIFFYIIGIIYFVFGYFPLAVRIFNIILSIASTVLIFKIVRKQFGEAAGRVFLFIGLFLPTQFIYSITLSKDFVRMFVISFVFWILYGGETCPKK